MLPDYLIETIQNDDEDYSKLLINDFQLPEYAADNHYLDLARCKYFHALITLRHYLKYITDYYFGIEQKAKNIDLFMVTSSISSPTAPGSNSEAIPLKFGELDAFLVDSSQFGFEPLLLNDLEKVYCYLPSMRGEDCNERHLSQFFHCEAEIKGELEDLMPIIEGYIKILCEAILAMPNIIERISSDSAITRVKLIDIVNKAKFPRITFDNAVKLLEKNGQTGLINYYENGRDITALGEIELMKRLDLHTPLWVMHYDRDRVPFYQKPCLDDPNKVINADLIFPPLKEGSFGGEVVGCGQRQDNTDEILESLKRQNIYPEPYLWYINLRRLPNYSITSGFGLGVERFIAWALGKDNIRDVILYPRIKNVKTNP